MEGQPNLDFESEWKQLTSEIPNIKYFKSVEEKKLIDILKKFMTKFNEYVSVGQFDVKFVFYFDNNINKNMHEKFTNKLKTTIETNTNYNCYSVDYVPASMNKDDGEFSDAYICVGICL